MPAPVSQQLAAAPVVSGGNGTYRKIQDVENSTSARVTTWVDGAPINIALDLLPFTTTLMHIRLHVNLSITSISGIKQDPWDRFIANLAIVSDKSNYYVNVLDMPSLQQVLRWKGVAAPRISFPAAATSKDYYIDYVIHFGVRPWRNAPDGTRYRDKYDLTAGIPPQNQGQLALTGSWGTQSLIATSGLTINSADISVRFWGRGALPGQSAAPMPLAIPQWSMQSKDTLTGSATNPGSQPSDVPNGNYLRQVLVQTGDTSSGVLTTRNDDVITDLSLWDTQQNHKIFGDSSWTAMVQTAQDMSDEFKHAVPDEGDTPGTINTSPMLWEPGQFWYDFARDGSSVDPVYGSNQNNVPTGLLRWFFGTMSGSNLGLRFFYLRYQPLSQPGGAITAQAVQANQGAMQTALQASLAG